MIKFKKYTYSIKPKTGYSLAGQVEKAFHILLNLLSNCINLIESNKKAFMYQMLYKMMKNNVKIPKEFYVGHRCKK